MQFPDTSKYKKSTVKIYYFMPSADSENVNNQLT